MDHDEILEAMKRAASHSSHGRVSATAPMLSPNESLPEAEMLLIAEGRDRSDSLASIDEALQAMDPLDIAAGGPTDDSKLADPVLRRRFMAKLVHPFLGSPSPGGRSNNVGRSGGTAGSAGSRQPPRTFHQRLSSWQIEQLDKVSSGDDEDGRDGERENKEEGCGDEPDAEGGEVSGWQDDRPHVLGLARLGSVSSQNGTPSLCPDLFGLS